MTIYVNTRLLCRSIAFSFFTVTISNTTFPNSPRILRLFNKNLKDKKKRETIRKIALMWFRIEERKQRSVTSFRKHYE